MKQLPGLSIIFFMLLTSVLTAQDMVFTFIPKDASNSIDSISATNLTSGESVFVSGSDQISFSTTSIDDKEIFENFSVFPNPSDGKTKMQFYAEQSGLFKINLFNEVGKIMASQKHYLKQGFHQFDITTRFNGLYLIQVLGDHTNLSEKIITTENRYYSEDIQYMGSTTQKFPEKSTVVDNPDIIHFLVYSGDQITKIADSPSASKIYEVAFYECIDAGGRIYAIIDYTNTDEEGDTIGNQVWMAENMDYLPSVHPPKSLSYTEPRYYVYNYDGNDKAEAKQKVNYETYGVLYNWEAAKTVCPDGWHLPSKAECDMLAEFIKYILQVEGNEAYNKLGEDYQGVGAHLKDIIGWEMYNNVNMIYGNDEFGFSARPGGYMGNGFFDAIKRYGLWWIVGDGSGTTLYEWYMSLHNDSDRFRMEQIKKNAGLCVRCIKD